ncbi:condensation domain-containing protein [Massilia sp. H-1]|nr:condensation domain-containing protein [Massilia sp. H-1]
MIAEELRQPFELARGRLIRARLFCLSETEHILCVTQHHIISDGWSRGVFVREMFALYTAFQPGQARPAAAARAAICRLRAVAAQLAARRDAAAPARLLERPAGLAALGCC